MSGGETSDHVRLCLTLAEVALKLGLSVRTVRREIQRGRFPRPVKIGARSLILRSELDQFMERKARER